MTTFVYYTILTAYCFFFGLAINYYWGKHSLNLGKPHIEQSPLIGNVNCATAFSVRCFWVSLGCIAHENVQKIFCRRQRSIDNLLVLNSVVVATGVRRAVAATIATTTFPAKGNVVSVVAKSLFLVDVQQLCKMLLHQHQLHLLPFPFLLMLQLVLLEALMSWLLVWRLNSITWGYLWKITPNRNLQ